MANIKRSLNSEIKKLALDNNKMALISGPRQVGKTFEAEQIAKECFSNHDYLNWDDAEFRKVWQQTPTKIIKKKCTIFDEIHKARNWKTTLKAIYDHSKKESAILVTGSTRIETFRRGGDSMMGRYFHFRLHPLTLGELISKEIISPDLFLKQISSLNKNSKKSHIDKFNRLIKFGGFPEPYINQDARFLKLWQKGRLEKLVRVDLRDISRIIELGQMEVFCSLLPEKISSVLSIKSLSEDMEVSYNTIKNWLNYLAALYYLYEIKPFSLKIPRSIKKEGKTYLWDYSVIKDKGARLENVVANHLLKAVNYWTDIGYGEFSLNFFRDKQKREVDFVIIKDGTPWAMFEVKSSNDNFAPNLDYFKSKWNTTKLSVVLTNEENTYRDLGDNRYIISMTNIFSILP
ncbi:MAG: ATP-binding protein [Bdellovibrionales bacterium]|nr:ATP-binding protein [Bdellovibrionales bacterium]MBT3524980.1 ATP-binding protein [Bdellovibrionales bacterium]MBT7670364.1 ATP-binding protein [Bdellovibrionales bacterium]MBT7766664.1 ATP-binding protein [Bdellovibrionales bacterium]